jgi:hypothetical protein
VSSDVRDDHVICIDVFVLEPSVLHGTLNEFDDGTGGLHRVSTWSNTAFSVSDHGRARASLALVAATESVRDGDGLAANVCTVRIDAEHLVEVGNSLAGGLVLDGTTDFETVLDVHVHVGCSSRSKTVALQKLRVTTLRELMSTTSSIHLVSLCHLYHLTSTERAWTNG